MIITKSKKINNVIRFTHQIKKSRLEIYPSKINMNIIITDKEIYEYE